MVSSPSDSFNLTNGPYGVGVGCDDFGSYDVPSDKGGRPYYNHKGDCEYSRERVGNEHCIVVDEGEKAIPATYRGCYGYDQPWGFPDCTIGSEYI